MSTELTYPKISIITVVFNGEEVLQQTIDSVDALEYPNKEYILIDGKSTDNTLDIIKDNISKIDQWISEKDEGLYDAMNKGMRLATGTYIWFLNAGDTIASSTSVLHAIEKKPDADIFYSDTVVVDPKDRKLGLLSELTHNNAPSDLTWQDMHRGMVVCHQSFIVKKTVAPEFDLQYRFSSDIDWVIKCLKNSQQTVQSKEYFANFLAGGLSKQYLKTSMTERYRILQKHFGFWRNLLNHIFIAFRYLVKGRKSKLNT